MSKKLKGVRPLDDINAEYSQACGQLGNFTFRRSVLAKEIEKISHRLEELDLEAGACKEQMEAAAGEPTKATDAEPAVAAV